MIISTIMFQINYKECKQYLSSLEDEAKACFRLTIRNVNEPPVEIPDTDINSFRLTIRNVNAL